MKHAAARLAHHLEKDGFTVASIHGDKTQSARARALADFKAKKVQILVATDVAARGIDIEELPHVVNFELPANAEDYVHRIGRTGRAGMTGTAVSLMSAAEQPQLEAIEALIKKSLNVIEPEGYESEDEEFLIEEKKAAPIKKKREERKPRREVRGMPFEPKEKAFSRRTENRQRTKKADIGFDYVLPEFDFDRRRK
jgi:ATP-dependent RNA helicase RhlE